MIGQSGIPPFFAFSNMIFFTFPHVDNQQYRQFPPFAMGMVEFNKFPFDCYVNKNVSLGLNLARDMERQLDNARFESKIQFRPETTMGDFIAGGIRLSTCYLDASRKIEPFPLCDINKHELVNCATRLCAVVELGLSRIVVYFAEEYASLDSQTRYQVIERPEFSAFSEFDFMCREFNDKLRSEMFSAFNLGKLDGMEDGQRMMRVMLGKNPTDTCWYPYVEIATTTTEKWLEGLIDEKEKSKYVLVPIKVEDRSTRNDLFRHLLDQVTKEVGLVEAVMQNLLILRLRYFLSGRRQEPVDMDRSFQTETALRSRLQKVLDLLYKLGYYCGFETGERVVRYVYFSSHSDENTYSFLPLDDKSKWLVVDTSMSTSCDCQERCARYIRLRTNWKVQQEWEMGLVEVSEKMKALAQKLDEKEDIREKYVVNIRPTKLF